MRDLTEDPLARYLSVYRAMPDDDRETIIGVLEREIPGRHPSRGTEKPVGQATHVNPNARLYIRSHETEFDSRHFDFEQMRIANVRAHAHRDPDPVRPRHLRPLQGGDSGRDGRSGRADA